MKFFNASARSNTSLKTVLGYGVGLTAIAALSLPASAQDASGDDGARKLETVKVTATKREQTLQDVPIAVTVVDEAVIADAQINDILDLQSVVPSLRISQLQQSHNSTFLIRGFGNGGNNIGVEPSVAVYIDGVFRTRAAGGLSDYSDIERIEVLRGPQSTLFGKNSSAGVVSVVTQKPEFDWGGNIEGTLGNYNQQIVKGRITGPLADKLAFSLSGSFNTRDGYVDNELLGTELNDRDRYALKGQLLFEPSDDLSFRFIADYDELDEICCYAPNFVNGPTGAAVGAIAGDADLVAASLAGETVRDVFDYAVDLNFDPTNEVSNQGISAEVNYDTAAGTITYIGSYREQDVLSNADADFGPADLIGSNVLDYNIETFTHEVRLSGSRDRFDYLLGGFYFDETVDLASDVTFGSQFVAYADALGGGAGTFDGLSLLLTGAPGNFFVEGTGSRENFTQDNQSLSLFAQGDFRVTDKLTATLGLGYIDDKKDVTGEAVNTDLYSSIDLAAGLNNPVAVNVLSPGFAGTSFDNIVLAQAFAGFAAGAAAAGTPLPFTDITALATAAATGDPVAGALLGQVQAIAADPATIAAVQAGTAAQFAAALDDFQFLPGFVSFPNGVEDGSTQDDKVTVTARLAYDVNDSINIYGSYATGYKASSWNLTRDSSYFATDLAALQTANVLIPNGRNAGTRFAGPEETTVFEIGAKMAFDNFSLNLALFDQTIEGFQSTIFSGTGFVLANAGEQSTQGLEFDAVWLPFDGLTLNLAGLLQDPEYDDFRNAPVVTGGAIDLADGTADGIGDLSGQQPAGIAETSLTFGAKYEHDLTDAMSGFVRAGYLYESDVQVVDNIVGLNREVGTLDASFGLDWDNGMSLTVWGRNLNDDELFTSGFPTTAQPGSVNTYANVPQTYGITIRKDF